MLNTTEIIQRKLVLDASGNAIVDTQKYREVGYDVKIAKLIDMDGKEITKFPYYLAPQKIVWAISEEHIDLTEKSVMAYVSIRTTLCNRGALALNAGIVDPGYKGLISTAFVNFGKKPVRFDVGDAFLRATFHALSDSSPNIQSLKRDEDYIHEVKSNAEDNFGETFLNVKSTLKRHHRDALISNLPFYTLLFTGLSFFLALVIAFIGIAFSYFATIRAPKDVRATIQNQDAILEYLKREDGSRVVKLEKALIELDCQNSKKVTGSITQYLNLTLATEKQCVALETPNVE